MTRSLAVLDIDGVVADVEHRVHHLDARPPHWAAFFAAAGQDTLLPEGAALAETLAAEHDIVWLSGRPEWLREVTEAWLITHGLPGGRIVLRGDNDRRPAAVFKVSALRRLAEEHSVAAMVDDDPDVIGAALSAGFPAALADWAPRARTRGLTSAQRSGRT